ncbi:FAD-binding oxidoreductase [Methylomonas sp. AM2-LC]|uniref:FAD-binding oxidoreductase n=1 Tax=Methylomonas sp. AM2-LC TaxID=3153301 RepID=UPI0032640CA7
MLNSVKQIATVETIEKMCNNVVLLRLRIGNRTDMPYQAGQYIAIHLNNGETRCYSMANSYQPGRALEFYIRLRSNGLFSTWLQEALSLQPQQPLPLSISGPYGNCVWHDAEQPAATTLMLATGTGIVPLAAILEERLAANCNQAISLYWADTEPSQLFLANEFNQLAIQYPNFKFVPILTQRTESKTEYIKFITDRVVADLPCLEDSLVYACGSPSMIATARERLMRQCNMKAQHFYADAFSSSGMQQPRALSTDNQLRVQLLRSDGETQELLLPNTASLLTGLKAQGLLQGICGGNKSCGSCRIHIEAAWMDRIEPADRVEARLLNVLDNPTPYDRLACQIQLHAKLEDLCFSIPS